MTATLLATHRVEKPWGRHNLWPGFPDPASDGEPIGEIWFQMPGNATPDLLIKYLFTSEKLSVQNHPSDEEAHKRGLPRGKDECWLILAAEPDSTIAIGPKAPVGADELRAAALDGSIVDLLDWKPVKAGDFYYSHSGVIHAIGAGLTLIGAPLRPEGGVAIHADLRLYSGQLEAGQKAALSLAPGRRAWVQVASGAAALGDAIIAAGDGAAVEGISTVTITAIEAAVLLIFDMA